MRCASRNASRAELGGAIELTYERRVRRPGCGSGASGRSVTDTARRFAGSPPPARGRRRDRRADAAPSAARGGPTACRRPATVPRLRPSSIARRASAARFVHRPGTVIARCRAAIASSSATGSPAASAARSASSDSAAPRMGRRSRSAPRTAGRAVSARRRASASGSSRTPLADVRSRCARRPSRPTPCTTRAASANSSEPPGLDGEIGGEPAGLDRPTMSPE